MPRQTRTLTSLAFATAFAMLALLVGGYLLHATSSAAPSLQVGGVQVSGRVFFDENLNGSFDAGEPAVNGAQVELRDAGGNRVQGPITTTDSASGVYASGVYTFTFVAAGTYTVVETDAPTYASTSPNVVTITVGSDPVGDVNFGDVLKLTVSGRVYEDLNHDGAYNPHDDQPMPGATVLIVDDQNGNGWIDAGEPIVGSAVADSTGNFAVHDIMPGAHRLMAVQPALGGVAGDPLPVSLPASPAGGVEGVVALYIGPRNLADLAGTVWNDIDGDEDIESGEAPLAGVKLELYSVVSGTITTTLTDANGRYGFSRLSAGWPYELRPVTITLPAGWIMSADPASLAFTLATTPTTVVNIGYFDPLSFAPLRQSDWKKELKQAGKPRYTPAQVDEFVARAERQSAVFAEAVGICDALLHTPFHGEAGSAYKEHAALMLNLASSRLYAATPLSLPELTMATTIGAAVSDIEGVLAYVQSPNPPSDSEYKRVRRLAEAVNSGNGLGLGRPGVFAAATATYKGASVAPKLRPAGEIVDLATDAPIYISAWNPGTLNPATNVFGAQARIKVKNFAEGGVLDVIQLLPDGRVVVLGTAIPAVWNKDVNATYLFDLRGVSTAAELIGAEIRLVARDINDGKPGRVRVDSAELAFAY